MKCNVVLALTLGMPVLSGAENSVYQVSNRWGMEPLGAAVPVEQTTSPRHSQPLKSRRVRHETSGSPLCLIKEGKAEAVIVIADKPSAAAKEAASDFQSLLQKASGVKLPLVREKQVKPQSSGTWKVKDQDYSVAVFIGSSATTRSNGIDGVRMPPEGFRIKTTDRAVFVVGNDKDDAGRMKLNGTYFAVSDLLETLGFRFLWPGETGTVIPAITTVSIVPCDIEDAPALTMRKIRNYGSSDKREPELDAFPEADRGDYYFSSRMLAGMKSLNFPPREMGAWYGQGKEWFLRQRVGQSNHIAGNHSMDGWWNRFGHEHPEWFALQPDGSRTQHPPRENFCFSNPNFIQAVVADRVARFKADPSLDSVSISPEDATVGNYCCMCENCRRLDPLNSPGIMMNFGQNPVAYVSMSDRYFKYFSAVAEGIAKSCPGKLAVCYAYHTYRSAPLATFLPSNLVLGFVGLTYDNNALLTQDRAQWDAWAAKAEKIYLRPNAFHNGHGVLMVYPHELARDIKHCYSTGMIGVDFDAVIHHWSTQGLNYYILPRLLWDPSQSVDEIIADYCEKGFESAALEIAEYFRLAEKLTSEVADFSRTQIDGELREEEINVHTKFPIWTLLPSYYSPARLKPLEDCLERARQAAVNNPAVLKRINFLAAGLDYTRSQAAAFAVYNHKITDSAEIKRILTERRTLFRHLFRDCPFAINLAYIGWREGAIWRRFPGGRP